MIGCSNCATLGLALTGAALIKLKYLLGTDLGRRLRLQVIVPFQPQHIITTKVVVHCKMHTLTEYLLSFIFWILGSAYYKRGVIMSTKRFTSAGLVAVNGCTTSKNLQQGVHAIMYHLLESRNNTCCPPLSVFFPCI
jgi:hypothetical protein